MSTATGAKGILAKPESCGNSAALMLAGHVIAGASTSRTTTVNEQVATPDLLEAEQLTLLVPRGNTEPDGGVQTTMGSGTPVTVGLNETGAEHCPTVLLARRPNGQVMVGAVGRAAWAGGGLKSTVAAHKTLKI